MTVRLLDLFISHSWGYNAEYYKLVEMLNNAPFFRWRNYSVPEHDPVVGTDEFKKRVLISELDGQIKPVNCVLILSGMYVNHSEWILKEIDIAQGYGKPIVGIRPWASQVVPKVVTDAAVEIVGWNTPTIVRAIRDYSL